jgi:alkylhydroperoxidase/carboxymuconolactone decarboxylase family protein YurZ
MNEKEETMAARKKQLRDEFIDSRGYWNAFWDSLLDLDEEFFEAYTRFSSVPWKSGPLPPKIKEFVYIAVDAAATHLYEPGIRQHIKQALVHGATAAEIMEVLELTDRRDAVGAPARAEGRLHAETRLLAPVLE